MIVVPSDSKLVIASPEALVTKSQKVAVADPRAVPAGILHKGVSYPARSMAETRTENRAD